MLSSINMVGCIHSHPEMCVANEQRLDASALQNESTDSFWRKLPLEVLIHSLKNDNNLLLTEIILNEESEHLQNKKSGEDGNALNFGKSIWGLVVPAFSGLFSALNPL